MALLVLVLSLGVGGYAWADPGDANGNTTAPGQAQQADGSPGNAYAYGQADGTTNGATSQGADSSQVASSDASSNGQSANGATSQGTDSQARLAVTSTSLATTTTGAAGSSDHSNGNASTSGDPGQPQPKSNADQNQGGANGDCGAYCSTRNGDPSGNGKGDDKGANAWGKPCAGCVGKADNKNPPGQYKDGSDHNAGYECDRNQGIGQTNPAHTGCTTSTPDCVPSTANNNCGHGTPPDCVPGTANNNCGNPPPTGCQSNCGNPPPTNGCPAGQVMGADSSCGCPTGMTEDDSGHCAAVPPAVFVCSGGQVMQDNGDCACPRGQSMVKGQCTKAQIKGKQVFRPKPHVQVGPPVTAPAAAGMPNTGADSGLGLDAMAGAGMLLAGGALLLLRRRLARR